MSDPQVKKVYAMERMELRGHMIGKASLRVLRSFAKRLCTRFKVPQVTVVIRREHGCAAEYTYESKLITLHPEFGVNLLSLCHELAHHIAWHKHPRSQPHGPTFMAYYACLLDAIRLVPWEGMKAACRKYSVKIG